MNVPDELMGLRLSHCRLRNLHCRPCYRNLKFVLIADHVTTFNGNIGSGSFIRYCTILSLKVFMPDS